MRYISDIGQLCPCHSSIQYDICCKPFHTGENPTTAVQLMRSRYAAYVLSLPEYIIRTTHPASPQFHYDKIQWAQEVVAFSMHTTFTDLQILASQESETFSTVTFIAHLFQEKNDISFTEKSYFEKVHGVWLYRNGHVIEEYDKLNTYEEKPSQLRLLPLAYYGDPILRQVADPVLDITDEIRALVESMIETMDSHNAIGIAAPQVHHPLRLFIVRPPIEDKNGQRRMGKDVKIFINPILSLPSVKSWKVAEGCLSIPGIRSDVERAQEITVEYLNLAGNTIIERVSGWQARVILHENDHIDGILFIDHLHEMTRKELMPLLQDVQKRLCKV